MGNGKATVILFARNGAHVVCVDVNRDAAEETAGITSPASVFRSDGGLTCRAA